jgi:hypothetical protein
MAKTFIDSGLFSDVKSVAAAAVKIMAGNELGIPPFAAINGIHIIQGKPVLGAGLIASRIKGSGKYDYKIVLNDDRACSIDFYQGPNKIGNSTFTAEDAKKAGTKNLDKYARNMLFARAISNGAKWHCPDIFSCSVYTEGEIQDVDFTHVVNNSDNSHPDHAAPPPIQPHVLPNEMPEHWQKRFDNVDSKESLKALFDSFKSEINASEILKREVNRLTAKYKTSK